jgi:hypothetical protein
MLFIDYLAIAAVISFFLTGVFLAMYIANRSYLPEPHQPDPYQHLDDEQRQIELATTKRWFTFEPDEVYCDVCGTHYTTDDPCPFH